MVFLGGPCSGCPVTVLPWWSVTVVLGWYVNSWSPTRHVESLQEDMVKWEYVRMKIDTNNYF